jgi:hypothetical protein
MLEVRRTVTGIHTTFQYLRTFVFGDGLNPATIVVNPGAWFVGTDGFVLDPTDEANRGEILANIRCSMRVFTGDADDHEKREASTCAAPGSALGRFHEASKAQCRSEDEHRDWEGCHHCCGAPQTCKPREPAPPPAPAPAPSPAPAPGPVPAPGPAPL